MTKIEFKVERPSAETFQALFETTGWNQEYQASVQDFEHVLKNSQFVTAAYEGDRLVGVGRVLTDGVMHAMIYDLIIHPDYQGQGIGQQILQMLIQWCGESGIRDIQLFCAQGKRIFYEKNGFTARPEDAPGMQFKRAS